MRHRRSQAETTEDNRSAVLAAAREQFGLRGYHGATVDSIAESAGFSKGVVYSQFGSKDDLFLAVLEASIEARRQTALADFDRLRGPEDLPTVVAIMSAHDVASVAWQTALIEFRVHAWRHPAVNARYAALHERTVDYVSALLSDLYLRGGVEPPCPSRELAQAALATGAGLLVERLADPDLVMSDVLAALGVFGFSIASATKESS